MFFCDLIYNITTCDVVNDVFYDLVREVEYRDIIAWLFGRRKFACLTTFANIHRTIYYLLGTNTYAKRRAT